MGGMKALLPVAEDQLIERLLCPIAAKSDAPLAVDPFHPDSQPRADPVLPVPIDIVQNDVVGRFLPGQDARQQNAVVVGVSLVAENGYLEIAAALEDLLNAGHARHSIAHHDQPFHAPAPTVLTICFAKGTTAAATWSMRFGGTPNPRSVSTRCPATASKWRCSMLKSACACAIWSPEYVCGPPSA